MESKFRLSPMMESYASQRLEDRNRDKTKKKNVNNNNSNEEEDSRIGTRARVAEREREKEKETTTVPAQTRGPAKKVSFDERVVSGPRIVEQPAETITRGKTLPYVDVPPLRATLRPPVTEPVKEDQNTKNNPAYKSKAPVEVGLDIERLVETVLDLEINVPLRSLAGISAAVQKEIRKQVTKTRWPTESGASANLVMEEESQPFIRLENMPVASYSIMTDVSDDIPEGYLVADDPVLQYLAANKDANPGELIVAESSEPLRSAYMVVNQVGQEECLLDPGSMIVSMSREGAIDLGLTWDPSLSINMESASKHVERTLGLARNVRFAVGGLNLFLQVHVLENPPYRVLLGRPFDRLTGATVKNNTDGSAEIILTDPNSKEVAVVPTYRRGVRPEDLQKQKYQAFC